MAVDESANEDESTTGLARLVRILARLRDAESGCAWDKEQTFATIAPYTIEEAYEVAEAIRRDDMEELEDELGDLQLQIVYHSRIAQERGAFAIDDVISAACMKMIRRHPHIFGGETESPGWEALKASERRSKGSSSALDDVALALPALKRAEKLQQRAARIGFDWPDISGPRAKIDEELSEVEAARTPAEQASEIGDLLFSVVNYARHLGVDPETALREASTRFEERFRQVEQMAERPLQDMDLAQLECLWQRAKQTI